MDQDRLVQANTEFARRLQGSRVVLTAIRPAREVFPWLSPTTFLVPGPPLPTDVCVDGALRGAVMTCLLLEGAAGSPEEAHGLLDSGKVTLVPASDHGVVIPLVALVTGSMPVLEVVNEPFGTRGYSTINEGMGVTLRAGGCGEGVLRRLRWIREELAPVLGEALGRMDGLPLDEVFRWALQMGDELHSRNVAATGVVIQRLLPHMAAAASGGTLVEVCRFLTEDNPQFFLNFGIAAARAILDAARDIPGSSLVTDLASNGLRFGLRVSGLGARWFTAPLDPAMLDEVTYFQGFSKADANPLIGGSFLMEALGLGALVQVNAPALLKSTAGLTIAQARALGEEMAGITWGRNPNFPVGALDFQGAPLGIDVIKVVERRCPPIMNFAVCSRHPGQGRIIGYGKSRAPLACFEAACRALQGEGP